MCDYIKYQRFSKNLREGKEVQNFFDELIKNGWEIIYYSERIDPIETTKLQFSDDEQTSNTIINIVVVVGKKNFYKKAPNIL